MWSDSGTNALARAGVGLSEEFGYMGIATEDLPGGILRVILDGRLDIEGAAAIDLRMNVIAGAHKAVLVDLGQVSFLGSMGLRALVSPARAIKNRGGKLVLCGPNEMVANVLKTSGIDTLIPVCGDLETAIAALQ
jgi:anti-sigma B factor antagonist